MLHLVGLGLSDEKDITVRGLEIVKKAERVYLEAYTAILLVDKEKLVSVAHVLELSDLFNARRAWNILKFDHGVTNCNLDLVGGVLWSSCSRG